MNGGRTLTARWVALGLLVTALAVASAACSVDNGDPSAQIEGLGSSLGEIQRLARREGELNLVTWPEYAHASWAGAFEQQTGCDVSATDAASSDAMVSQIEDGSWDGVSVSGGLSGRLIAGGEVAPLNTELIPNHERLQQGVKNQPHASLDGRPYGVPHGRGPNLLLFRTDAFSDDNVSWSLLWEAPPRLKGRLSIYDDAMAIADAAVYLKATRPGLGIDNPYELDEVQFRAAVALLRRQAGNVGLYWTRDIAKQVASYSNGDLVVGTTWPHQVELLETRDVPLKAVKPVEGTTGWSDTWMVSSNAANPNCMYLWMDYVISPEAQAKIAEFFRQAPVNPAACELTDDRDLCTELHAQDEAWWEDVYYWTTPMADCGDSRGEVCKTHEDWEAAWTMIKAGR